VHTLGISCYYHDSAAALVSDGQLQAGAVEERFTGVKHDSSFPCNAIRFCLNRAGITIKDLASIVFYEKPFSKFDRICTGFMAAPFRSYHAYLKAMPSWLKQKLWTEYFIRKTFGYDGDIMFVPHHWSHAAAAYYSSPFESAAILTLDGVGEWETSCYGVGRGQALELLGGLKYPHSLGLLYSAFTAYLGFRVNSAEYKVMGLAAYGEPCFQKTIEKEIIRVEADGAFCLNLDYFAFPYGRAMTNARFHRLFGGPPRRPDQDLGEREMDIAASIQAVLERTLIVIAGHVRAATGESRLCYGGGVALNAKANAALLRSGIFDDVYIPPAPSDSGSAAGAALYVQSLLQERLRRRVDYFKIGPAFGREACESVLKEQAIPYTTPRQESLIPIIAEQIERGQIVAIFQGPMEFGPRALGFRSIVADPVDPAVKNRLNHAVKFRESFRPFAPTVLEEAVSEYFVCDRSSPHMLFNFEVRPDRQDRLGAVTHVDRSARLQTVNEEQNRFFYGLLKEYQRRTGLPVLLNTSFNLRGYPIVHRPLDALRTFCSGAIDYLVMEGHIVDKADLTESIIARLRLPDKKD